MQIDPPAKIVIIGAGPIGLETALYARYLGYEVEILEVSGVCSNVLQWGHVSMFSPFGMNSSTLGLAALKAQDADYEPPAPEAILTGREWAQRYLIPLSQSDLLADHIRIGAEVDNIVRSRYLKHESPGDPIRGEDHFEVHYTDTGSLVCDGEIDLKTALRVSTAKVVIDCSGTYGTPNPLVADDSVTWLAIDEISPIIETIPDPLGRDRERFSGKHSIVAGSGYSAATTVVALAKLAKEEPDTRITWLTRRSVAGETGPIALIDNDRLPKRDELARQANELATSPDSPVEWLHSSRVVSIRDQDDEGLVVTYRRFPEPLTDADGDDEAEPIDTDLPVDLLVANVGYRPGTSIFRELQVHLCYATEGPMKLAAALMADSGSSDCLDQTTGGPAALVTTEPNFYVLGSKSYGRNSHFLFKTGLEQIRDLFTIIGGRETLDLYASVKNLA